VGTTERPYARLTEEEKSRVLLTFKQMLQQGFCRPQLDCSLLGFDWSLFSARSFPEHAEDPAFLNPPEFLALGFSTLDAYVTAVLGAHLKHGDFGEMTFSCRLNKEKAKPKLRLEFATVSERRKPFPKSVDSELRKSFPELLQVKRLEAEVCEVAANACRVVIAYPGKMIAERCPFLRNRPLDLWPEVRFKVLPTEELVARARDMVTFASDVPFPGNPN
jgi:hypothetical protein